MGVDVNNSYPQLKMEILQFLHAQSVDGRVQAMILDLVNQALRAQRVVLSNPEKEALSREILREILGEMLSNLP